MQSSDLDAHSGDLVEQEASVEQESATNEPARLIAPMPTRARVGQASTAQHIAVPAASTASSAPAPPQLVGRALTLAVVNALAANTIPAHVLAAAFNAPAAPAATFYTPASTAVLASFAAKPNIELASDAVFLENQEADAVAKQAEASRLRGTKRKAEAGSGFVCDLPLVTANGTRVLCTHEYDIPANDRRRLESDIDTHLTVVHRVTVRNLVKVRCVYTTCSVTAKNLDIHLAGMHVLRARQPRWA